MGAGDLAGPVVSEDRYAARQVGLGDATLLRHHFKALRGTTPSAYRTNFAGFRARDLATGA